MFTPSRYVVALFDLVLSRIKVGAAQYLQLSRNGGTLICLGSHALSLPELDSLGSQCGWHRPLDFQQKCLRLVLAVHVHTVTA